MSNEVELSNGTVVKCRHVAWMEVSAVVANFPACRMPSPPIEEVKGRAGVTREPAQPGTAEYEEWEQAADQVRRLRQQIENDARYYLGVEEWKLPGDKKFSNKVPKDWQFPWQLADLGVRSYEEIMADQGKAQAGRRWDFILHGLGDGDADLLEIGQATVGSMPLTEDEVAAAEDEFKSDQEGDADSEPAGE